MPRQELKFDGEYMAADPDVPNEKPLRSIATGESEHPLSVADLVCIPEINLNATLGTSAGNESYPLEGVWRGEFND